MQIYAQLINEFSQIPYVKEWNEVQSLFRRVALREPKHWLLPLRACESVGGDLQQAIPAILAVACSHIGLVLVDDMLDGDPRGEHLKIGQPATANMALALQSAALAVIARCNLNQELKLLVMESVNEMFLATSIGQYWDVNSIVSDEDSYWKIAQGKSSPFFSASLQIGGLIGGASMQLINQIKNLGDIYGEMIQIHDDLHDTLETPAQPDWNLHHSSLPILFARLVDHPKRIRFEELLPNARSNSKALEEAQEILIQCGAISYCVYQLLEREKVVKNILSGLSLARRDVFEKIFDDIVEPVSTLFYEVDKTFTQREFVDAA